MVDCHTSLPEASVSLVWAISFIATLWRFAGPAREHSSNFVLAAGVTLLVFQCFSGLVVCLFKWLRNPPFGFVWVYSSLLLTNLMMHVAILGSDIARVTLDAEHAPFNLIEYDVTTVVCQAIFLAGIWSIAMGAGSHEAPPAWAHRGRRTRRPGGLVRDGDVAYAGGVEAQSHRIGPDSDNDEDDEDDEIDGNN